MFTVLFICTHNAGRSQMAEAFFNRLAQGQARALSAGSEPAKAIQLAVVQAMTELGFDLRGQKPKLLTSGMLAGADRIVSMGCGVACPTTTHEDWGLADPAGQGLPEVRRLRDEIQARVACLVRELKI
jgi:arsenate reductase (thioredoxin)